MVYYIVGSLLLAATITDIFWRRIPNILVLIYFVSGIFVLHSDFVIRFCISLIIFYLQEQVHLSILFSVHNLSKGLICSLTTV